MSEKLKPCPFCGEEAFVHMLGNEIAKGYYIACDECGAKTIVFGYEAEAIEAWNRRAERTAKGEWVDGLPYVNSHWWVCSVCHVPAPENHTGYNFCPNCGADLRGE